MVSAERQAGCDVDKRGIEERRWTGPEREIHRTAGNTNVQAKKKNRNKASHNAATKRQQSTSIQRTTRASGAEKAWTPTRGGNPRGVPPMPGEQQICTRRDTGKETMMESAAR